MVHYVCDIERVAAAGAGCGGTCDTDDDFTLTPRSAPPMTQA